MIKVMIADDHAIVRHGLNMLLQMAGEFEVIGLAQNGDELLQLLHQQVPDVVLLDIAMPELAGYETLQLLIREYPGVAVLMLSMYPAEEYALRMLKSGAAGYLTKEVAPMQLVTAVRQLAAGRRFITPEVAELLAGQLCNNEAEAPHQRLSAREYQVLQRIATGMSCSEIAEQMGLSACTISTYRSRVLAKMRLNTTAELIHYAAKHRLVD